MRLPVGLLGRLCQNSSTAGYLALACYCILFVDICMSSISPSYHYRDRGRAIFSALYFFCMSCAHNISHRKLKAFVVGPSCCKAGRSEMKHIKTTDVKGSPLRDVEFN